MEEGQDCDDLAGVLSSDEEDQSYNGFSDHSLHGSGDGDEIPSPFHSSDEQRENERNTYSASYDYSDERHWLEGVPSSPKRRKIPEVDRISELPDSVIHHILSFLPAEDAVKTGALSKRWVYLWTSATKLTFRERHHPRFLQRFLRFVDKTLFFYSSSKMEKFELDFEYKDAKMRKSHLDSLIQKWLRLVTRRDIEELSLKFSRLYDGCGGYPIPQFVLDSSSLTKLRTTLCDYAPKGQVCWRWLRVLTIEQAQLSNDGLQKILLGSPMLQYMKLNGCRGITSIDVSSNSVLEYLEVQKCRPITHIDASYNSRLEKLVLKEMQNHEGKERNAVIEVLCPNLKSLEISGNWYQKMCRLLNVSSLIDVCLSFGVEFYQFDYVDISKELLEKIKHAKKITLGTWCLQVLSLLEFRELPSPLSGSSCEYLTLNTEINKWYPFGVAHLLRSFPTLQKLVIDMSILFEVEESPDEVFPINFQERVDRTFICLLEHLKTVEITGLGPYEPDDLEFIRFLLGNARLLKEMVIHFEREASEFDLYKKALFFDATQKLLSFPRCSPYAVVLVD